MFVQCMRFTKYPGKVSGHTAVVALGVSSVTLCPWATTRGSVGCRIAQAGLKVLHKSATMRHALKASVIQVACQEMPTQNKPDLFRAISDVIHLQKLFFSYISFVDALEALTLSLLSVGATIADRMRGQWTQSKMFQFFGT